MRLFYLLFSLFLTTQAIAYSPCYGRCGAPPGVRERFPRHTACCCDRCNEQCNDSKCCSQPQRVSPATGYSPCNAYRYRMCGNLEIMADALYWSSTRTPITTWTLQSGAPVNSVRSEEISPGYYWGARLFGQWNFPSGRGFIRGGYHYVRTLDHSHQRGGNIVVPWGTLGTDSAINAADASLKLLYQRAEIVGGFTMWQGWCSRFYAYGGGLWFSFDQKLKSDVHGRNSTGAATSDFSEKTHAQGIGGIAGFGGEYNITQGLFAVAKMGAIAAAAERTLKQAVRAPTTVIQNGRLNATYPSRWGLLPGLEAQLALRYTAGFCGLYLSGELGWEIQHYFNAFRTTQGSPAAGQTTFVDCGFSGPYAGLKLRF